MPSREQVSRALAGGTDYALAGRTLSIPAGQAYVHSSAENPTSRSAVHRWVARRAAEQGGRARESDT